MTKLLPPKGEALQGAAAPGPDHRSENGPMPCSRWLPGLWQPARNSLEGASPWCQPIFGAAQLAAPESCGLHNRHLCGACSCCWAICHQTYGSGRSVSGANAATTRGFVRCTPRELPNECMLCPFLISQCLAGDMSTMLRRNSRRIHVAMSGTWPLMQSRQAQTPGRRAIAVRPFQAATCLNPAARCAGNAGTAFRRNRQQ